MFVSGTHRPRDLLPLLLLSNIRSKAVNYSFTVEWSTFQSQGCGYFFLELPRAKTHIFGLSVPLSCSLKV